MELLSDFTRYADQLAGIARWAYRNGWAPGTSTNYSVRLPEYAAPAFYAITSSGVDKETIGPEQILAVDQHGQPVNGFNLRPSTETLLHLMVYRVAGAGAVFHTHSIAAALLSRLVGPFGHLTLSGWELLKGLDGVEDHDCEVVLPVYPNSQDMRALVAHIEPHLRRERPSYGFLLAGHGLYVWGKNVAEAKRHVEVLEFVLQCEREARTYGRASSS
ncbi:MAG TPA: methylthioribulose 1-phosphate dehydratase [Nitrospiraceae bacterium]|jgi:methylthioribulose-1-phosphate dehydratase|nr:methylthioribulose 1-phosphate dehydratase [Nitrospiraceae bacterium]